MTRDATAKLITATEIACFAYCPEQWRLQYGVGLPPTNVASLAAGTRHHDRNTAADRGATALIAWGSILVLSAAALLIFWVAGQWW